MKYKLYSSGVIRTDIQPNKYIPVDPANSDWQEYLQWLAAGNTPEPSDPAPPPVDPGPSLEDRVEAAETIIDLLLMEGE
jgi:hypothetical protein